jgi:hypothetical protein
MVVLKKLSPRFTVNYAFVIKSYVFSRSFDVFPRFLPLKQPFRELCTYLCLSPTIPVPG